MGVQGLFHKSQHLQTSLSLSHFYLTIHVREVGDAVSIVVNHRLQGRNLTLVCLNIHISGVKPSLILFKQHQRMRCLENIWCQESGNEDVVDYNLVLARDH